MNTNNLFTLMLITSTALAGQGSLLADDRAGDAAGGTAQPASSISGDARAKELLIVSGDRINGIELHGTDGSVASIAGKKKGPPPHLVHLDEGEYVIGFEGMWSEGGGPYHAGWINCRVIIGGPKGERLSERFGTSGELVLKLNGGAVIRHQDFTIRAPDGYEVVGFDGRAGDVVDFLHLGVRKR